MSRSPDPSARLRQSAPAECPSPATIHGARGGRRLPAAARPILAVLLLLSIMQPSLAGLLPQSLNVPQADAAREESFNAVIAANAPEPRWGGLTVPRVVDAQAKTSYEAPFNPFGDEWTTKGPSNLSIPVGLTPACFRRSPKWGNPPSQLEAGFLAKTNSPFLWEECADIYDASGPNIGGVTGVPALKANIDAVKAINPTVKYIGYLNLVRAETFAADGSTATVGLNYIHRNREDWFVHINGAAATLGNRVVHTDGRSHVYDITNASFRQFIVARIVESLNYHNMDGLVVDKCFDLPEYSPSTVPPSSLIQGWEAGCLSILSELKSALEPYGKYVFFTGYIHLGTCCTGSANEIASESFYQRRLDRAHGFYWEDPFRAVNLPAAVSEYAFERAQRLRDYAVARNKYIVNIVNTNAEGQSSYGSSSYAQQEAFARYYLAGYLAWMRGSLTVLHHYTPTEYGSQFLSNAFFNEWDLNIGNPVGNESEPTAGVYVRSFQNARVVFNSSASSYTVSLADGTYLNSSGQPVGASATVPSKTGAIFVRQVLTPTPTFTPTPTPTPTVTPTPILVCPAPRPPVQVSTAANGDGRLRVTLSGGAPPFLRVVVGNTTNAVVDVNGGPTGVAEQTITIPGHPSSFTFYVRRVGSGSSTVPLTIVDACGNWSTFVGGGASAF